MSTISTLAVNLIARTSVFERNIRKSRKTVISLEGTLKKASRGFRNFRSAMLSVSRITGISAGFRVITAGLRTITRLAKLAALALIGIGIASVKLRTDVEETSNLFVIAMGDMAESAQNWVTRYSRSLGLFENNTKKALSTFQLMLVSMGFTEKAAFDMSKGLVQVTNDIASLRNLKLEEAFTKIRAGIVGESEPLKAIGILINETTIKQLALNDATRDSSKELTELEKVQFRYKAILNATERDQGDFKRTLDSTSNVFKIIKEQVQVTANTIGKVFIPQVTETAIKVRDWLIESQGLFESWATKTKDAIGAVIERLQIYFALAKAGKFEAIFTDLGRVFGDITAGIESALRKIRPIAIDMGDAIAQGFFEAIEGSVLGKFLAKTKTIVTDPAGGSTLAGAAGGAAIGSIAGPAGAVVGGVIGGGAGFSVGATVKITRDIADLSNLLGQQLSEEFKAERFQRDRPDIGTIMERALNGDLSGRNRTDIEILNELKKMNIRIRDTTE